MIKVSLITLLIGMIRTHYIAKDRFIIPQLSLAYYLIEEAFYAALDVK
jgi:hypothetical protein